MRQEKMICLKCKSFPGCPITQIGEEDSCGAWRDPNAPDDATLWEAIEASIASRDFRTLVNLLNDRMLIDQD